MPAFSFRLSLALLPSRACKCFELPQLPAIAPFFFFSTEMRSYQASLIKPPRYDNSFRKAGEIFRLPGPGAWQPQPDARHNIRCYFLINRYLEQHPKPTKPIGTLIAHRCSTKENRHLENLQPLSLDPLLSPTSFSGPALGRSQGRHRANASTKSQGEQKQFVLPEDPAQETVATDSPAAKPQSGQAKTLEPRKKPRSDESLNAPTEGLAVNPLASANLPEAVGEAARLTNPVPLTVLNPIGPIGQTMRASGTTATTSTNVGALIQEAQGTSQSPSGTGQAIIVDPSATFAAGPQGADGAITGLDAQSQSPATQATATMTPGVRATWGQVAGEAVNSQAQQVSDLSGGAAASIPAATTTATVATANAAVQAGQALETSTTAKVAAVSQNAGAGSQAAAEPGLQQVNRTGPRSLSEILQRSFQSTVSDKSAAGLNSPMPDSAEVLAQTGQAQKTRGVSLPEAARSVEPQAPETNVLAGALGSVRGSSDAPATAEMPAGNQASVEMPRPAEQVIENIRQAVQNGQRDLTINLNPPELGRLRIRMYTEGDEIRGRLEVDNPRSFNEIRQQAELLTQRLVEEGIMLRRLDVHLSPSANQTTGFSSPQHDGAGQGAWGQAGGGNGTGNHGPNHQNNQLPELSDAGAPRIAAKTTVGDSLSGEGLNVWI